MNLINIKDIKTDGVVITTIGDYTLIYRHVDFQPWIVAYKFCPEDGTWDQGHYFNDISFAIMYITEKECKWALLDTVAYLCSINGNDELADRIRKEFSDEQPKEGQI